VPARQFYPTLFADSAESKLTLRRIFRDDSEAVAFWFDFAWVQRPSAGCPLVDRSSVAIERSIADP
jgi:hypothetical protein